MRHKSFKYRLFTTPDQERELSTQLETHRRLYNRVLEAKQLMWDTEKVNWSFYEQSKWLTTAKRFDQFLKRANAKSLDQTLRRLDKAYACFFAGGGFPKFKSQDQFSSICFTFGNGATLAIGRLRIQFVGDIRVRWHREVPNEAKIKQVTITRDCGKWYACFSCELQDAPTAEPPAAKIGIDVGLTAFVTTSEGAELGDSRSLERNLKELRRKNRALARCQRGSSRRKKVKHQLAKLHQKVRRTRKDMHHKVALHLCKNYGLIAAECLHIQGMLGNRRLSRRISDAAWGNFIITLGHKCAERGCKLVLVNPKNTTQACHKCGTIVPKGLSDRWHECSCGESLSRDHNAAKGILVRAELTDVKQSNSPACPKRRTAKSR